MFFKPDKLGYTALDADEVKADRKKCLRFGPCGIGEKAVYLNSFFIDRAMYVAHQDVRRVFKRIAMTKGGFTGRGMFGSMPYLVVVLSDGSEKQCNFKYESDVDAFINKYHALYPLIPIHSVASEKKLAEERAREEARYKKDLSGTALSSIAIIDRASDYLSANIGISDELSRCAKQKRIIDQIKPGYKIFAALIVIVSSMFFIYGIYSFLHGGSTALYFLLFSAAFIFYALSMQVLPTSRNNSRAAQREFDEAVKNAESLVSAYDGEFPLPAKYAHPAALSRMKRIIREGRAETAGEAYSLMKDELKAINSSVTVSQTEYDEITAIKPIFLVCGYAD